jgi:hypothetical protein
MTSMDQARPRCCLASTNGWEKRWRRPILLSPTLGPYFLVALMLSSDLFICAKDLFVEAKPPGRGKDDYDKLSLPTGSGFPEDMLKAGTRRFITDAEFDRSGPKRFSCNEMKC